MKPKSKNQSPKQKRLEMLRSLKYKMDKTRLAEKATENITFMWGVISELDLHGKLPIIPYPVGDVTIQDLKGQSK